MLSCPPSARENARTLTNSANYRLPGIGTNSRAESSDSAAVNIEQSHSVESSDETCACGHSHALHDRIASRYCTVTAEGSLTRGCICPAPSAVSPAG
ncbi:RGCVC family protein [Actinospica sp.]|uniref:RGCVC family protein n=1 Tax=Actinospica sp. TaxID=1872142 RepID=UPI0032C21992